MLEGWECIGKEGEGKLHHYIIVTLCSLVHEKSYPINLIKMTKIENKNCKQNKKKALFTIKILFYRTSHLFSSWDASKRVRGGR